MIVNSEKLMQLAIQNERNIVNADVRVLRNIRNAVEVFTYKSFDKIIDENDKIKTRGMSANIENKKIMTYNVAGRIMVTLSDNENTVSIVGSDVKGSSPGLQSASGESDEILDLLEFFTENWFKIKLKEDKKITLN